MKTKDKDYILYALGTRGSRPVFGRDYEIFGGQTTCFIIKHDRHAVIIDCGTGLYEAENILKDCEIIDILFTHVHYDHILGLLDFSVFPKNARVNFFGTFKSWLSWDTIKDFYRHPFWPIQPNLGAICEITNDGSEYNLGDGIVMQSYNSSHPDFGNVIVLKIEDKKICFLFDIEDTDGLDLNIIKNADFLVYDGMFDDDEYADYVGWGHSTYQEGCRVACIYHVKELLITHHNPRSNDEKLLKQEEKAKDIFPKARFCRAGDIFLIK